MPRGVRKKKVTTPEPEDQDFLTIAPAVQEVTPKDVIPSIFKQGFDGIEVSSAKLDGGKVKFNGSVCRFKDKLYMAYRSQVGDERRIYIAELDEKFQPVKSTLVQISPHGSSSSFIDPRLFVHRDRLWLTFAEGDFVALPKYRYILRCVQLGKSLQPTQDLQIKYGQNYQGIEKNWMFFSAEDKLYFIYDLNPQVVAEVCEHTGQIKKEYKAKKFVWNLDHLRGGSPLIPYGENFIGFYHSGTSHSWMRRRYGLGAVEISGRAPFAVVRMTLPFIYGSQEDPYCGEGNPNCIFVSGIIDDGDDILASSGVNDSSNVIHRIPKAYLEEQLLPVSRFYDGEGPCYSIKGGKPCQTLAGQECGIGTLVRMSGMNGPTYYHRTDDPIFIEWSKGCPYVERIDKQEYETAVLRAMVKNNAPKMVMPDYLRKKPKVAV